MRVRSSGRWRRAAAFLVLAGGSGLGAAAADQRAAEADPDVVQVYSRVPQPLEQIGSSVSVFSADDIEAQGLHTLDDVLERLPGVTITRSGGVGQNTEVRMRGFTTKHALVLIDGVKVNNPSQFDNQFGIEHVMLENIERIEVLRGPQSGIYGADAVAGVINVVTRRGQGRPTATVSGMAGSNDTRELTLDLSGGLGDVGYGAALSGYRTGGVSVASRPPGNVEDDGYENLSFSGTFDWDVSDRIDLYGGATLSQGTTEIDAGLLLGDPLLPDFLFQDSAGMIEDRQGVFHLGGTLSTFDGRLTHDAEVSVVAFETEDTSPEGTFRSESETLEAQYFATLGFGDDSFVLVGADLTREDAYFDEVRPPDLPEAEGGDVFAAIDDGSDNTGVFATLNWQVVDGLFASLSLRRDDNERFGGVDTGRAALAYTLPSDLTGAVEVKLRTSYGTGREAPGLRQLNGRGAGFIGNPALAPEESYMVDAGVDLTAWEGDLTLSASVYYGEADNGIFIGFEEMMVDGALMFVSSPYNEASVVEMSGIELEGFARIGDRLRASVAYTNARSEVAATGIQLFGRPEQELSFAVTLDATEALSVVLDGYARGSFFSDYPTTYEMDGYALYNLSAGYDLTDAVRLSASVKNLFDRTYEEKLGDGTYGRTGEMRVEITF